MDNVSKGLEGRYKTVRGGCVGPLGLRNNAVLVSGASRHRLGLCQPSGPICV